MKKNVRPSERATVGMVPAPLPLLCSNHTVHQQADCDRLFRRISIIEVIIRIMNNCRQLSFGKISIHAE